MGSIIINQSIKFTRNVHNTTVMLHVGDYTNKMNQLKPNLLNRKGDRDTRNVSIPSVIHSVFVLISV